MGFSLSNPFDGGFKDFLQGGAGWGAAHDAIQDLTGLNNSSSNNERRAAASGTAFTGFDEHGRPISADGYLRNPYLDAFKEGPVPQADNYNYGGMGAYNSLTQDMAQQRIGQNSFEDGQFQYTPAIQQNTAMNRPPLTYEQRINRPIGGSRNPYATQEQPAYISSGNGQNGFRISPNSKQPAQQQPAQMQRNPYLRRLADINEQYNLY